MLTAEQILSDEYIFVNPGTSVGKAIEQMIEAQTSILLIVSADQQMIGTLEEGVTLRAAIDSQLRHDPVSLHMSRQFASVAKQAPIDVVLDQFVLHGLHFMPVVDAGGYLVGVISRSDLLRTVFGRSGSLLSP